MEYPSQPSIKYAGVIAGALLASTPSADANISQEPINAAQPLNVTNFIGKQWAVSWTVKAKEWPSGQDFTLIPDALKFRALANAWDQEAGVSSSTTEIVMCQSYQKIIGMGEKAIPFIFRQLEKERKQPNNWFWALRAITHADPVQAADRGDRQKMAAAWLRWGRVRYVW